MEYNQVIYGTLKGSDTYDIIAHTDEYTTKLPEIRKNIIEKYRFWANVSSPETHFNRNRYGDQDRVVAVGSFKYKFSEEENDYLVIEQVSILPYPPYLAPKYQYRYIFIPIQDLELIGYKTFYLLNQFSISEKVPQISQKQKDYPKVDISLLTMGISKKNKQKEVKWIIDSIKEQDNQEKAFIFSALAALINGQRLLIDYQDNLLYPNQYTIVLLLLPAIFRPEIPIAFGDINEKYCNWAKLLITKTEFNSGNLPNNCVWLNRKSKEVAGYNKPNNTVYESKIEKIINRAIEKHENHKIAQLLKDLEELELKQEKLALQNLSQDIEDIFEPPNEKPINLGIWGTTGSGKTTYLTMLNDCLGKGYSDFTIQDMDDQGEQFFLYHRDKIFKERVFPGATDPSNRTLNVFTYTVLDQFRIINEPIKLSFIDAPGKFFEDIGERNLEYQVAINQGEQPLNGQKQQKGIVDYLIDCDGIIFLLDPKRPKDSRNLKPYQNLFPLLFQQLRKKAMTLDEPKKIQRLNIQTKQLKLYAALCVTKVDDEDKFWLKRDRPKEFVMEVLDQAYKQLDQFLYFDQEYPGGSLQNRSQFFAISSIGRPHKNGKYPKSVVNPNELEKEESESPLEPEASWEFSPQESYDIDNPRVNNDPEQQSDTENLDDDDPFKSAFADSQSEKPTEEIPMNSQFSNEEREESKITFEPEPYEVTKPLEWLIQSIQANQQ